MITVRDSIINAELDTVLKVLKSELAIKGITRFNMFRPNGINIQTNCPFHKGGQERKPSFGINSQTGQCHCFTCGWAGNISRMISELFGRQDDGEFGEDWLIKRFNSIAVEHRPDIFVAPRSHNKGSSPVYVTEEELDTYRYTHPYHYTRGLTDELLEQFDIGYDSNTDCITFPVWDIKGNCVFVARRNVNTKFFNYPRDVEKPVYLANLFTTGQYKKAYITESFLNALTYWKYGKPAMALIGTGTEEQYEILNRLPVREYILALDPDEAGFKATERFRRGVKNKVIKQVVYNDDRDINDLQEQCLQLREIF